MWWWLAACEPARLSIDDAGFVEAPPAPPPPLDLVLDGPAPGAFAGDAPVAVAGRTTDAGDVVTIEGEVVPVADDGSFVAELPIVGDVRVITVTSTRGDETVTRRRTVYAGPDPRDSWPGALEIRLTPAGLDQLTVGVEEAVDAVDLPNLFADLIPPTGLSGFTFVAQEGTADPAVVDLSPRDGELFFGIRLPNFVIRFDASAPLLPPVPVVLGVEELAIGAVLTLTSNGDEVLLDVADTDVELRGPILELAGLDPGLVPLLTGGLLAVVGEVIEGALDLGLVAFDELVVPGGTLKTSALGFPLALSLDGVGVDEDGVVAALGVGLGAPAVAEAHRPERAEGPPGTDVLVSLHEGLLGALVSSDLLAALDLGTLELPGFLGEIVALPLSALPGGGELPADRTGTCVTIGLPTGGVGRVRGGLEPFATLILPDLRLDAAVTTPSARCSPWLSAELAVAADLDARGSALVVDLAVADGAVLDYAAEGSWTESEVVLGLGGLIDAVSTLLGSSLAIDLADLLDPEALGGTPAITSSVRPRDERGEPIPGVVVLGLTIE
jgi:hypothetical protein